mmetsp:Transcript_104515/g.302436  ORF Transcript_104515/g.302436 Transcript_104515/m.302436 type:complete len:227 (-) Transcript_104515:29-709(-)
MRLGLGGGLPELVLRGQRCWGSLAIDGYRGRLPLLAAQRLDVALLWTRLLRAERGLLQAIPLAVGHPQLGHNGHRGGVQSGDGFDGPGRKWGVPQSRRWSLGETSQCMGGVPVLCARLVGAHLCGASRRPGLDKVARMVPAELDPRGVLEVAQQVAGGPNGLLANHGPLLREGAPGDRRVDPRLIQVRLGAGLPHVRGHVECGGRRRRNERRRRRLPAPCLSHLNC